MTALSPNKLREDSTKRHETVDVIFKVSAANEFSKAKCDNEYVLNFSHEESITPIVKKHVKSYKDLPCAAYQVQTKFRNEARAKSGLMR